MAPTLAALLIPLSVVSLVSALCCGISLFAHCEEVSLELV